MWVDCNCGRRNAANDPCPTCGAGEEMNYTADILVAAENRCFEMHGSGWGHAEFLAQCEELAPLFRRPV